jgi:hypothetical protein
MESEAPDLLRFIEIPGAILMRLKNRKPMANPQIDYTIAL